MSFFDILVENQIASWEQRKADGKIIESSVPRSKAECTENYIIRDIENLYLEMKSLGVNSKERLRLDARSKELKTHLMISMERKGLFITSQNIAEVLYQKRREILG